MLIPSNEQQGLIDAIKGGFHIQVDAVAGSGKSTTVLCLADQNSEKNVLQLTYNAELRREVNEKRVLFNETMNLDNLTIYTYHSLAFEYYTNHAKTDIGINEVLEEELKPLKPLPDIDILVIDEAQDMNLLYFRFVKKIIKDTKACYKKSIQLLVLGDKHQGLYEFKGADTRFLTLAHKIWTNILPEYSFKILQLTVSFRITNQISQFINECMLGEVRICAVKEGSKIVYVRNTNSSSNYKIVGMNLINRIKSEKLKPEHICILSASVRTHSGVKSLENMLVSHRIPCYVPMNEVASINSDSIRHKTIFSTFHQFKGRERPYTLILGFDKDYFKFYNRQDTPNECPSTLYVGATRSTEHLEVLETSDPLPFLKKTPVEIKNSSYIEFQGIPQGIRNDVENTYGGNVDKQPTIKTNPTNMIRFLNEGLLIKFAKIMRNELFVVHSLPLNEINIKSSAEFIYDGCPIIEEVSDINGIVIPSLYEERYSKNRVNNICKFVKNHLENSSDNMFYYEKCKEINFDEPTLEDHLKIVNVYISIRERLFFKLVQINKYDWLTTDIVEQVFANMNHNIKTPEKLVFEESLIEYGDETYEQMDLFMKPVLDKIVRLSARVDAMDDETIWEFKCTESLEPEHQLQVVIYAWIWNMTRKSVDGERIFQLMNIRTGEVQTLVYNETIINEMMIQLFTKKYTIPEKMNDEEFCNHLTQ